MKQWWAINIIFHLHQPAPVSLSLTTARKSSSGYQNKVRYVLVCFTDSDAVCAVVTISASHCLLLSEIIRLIDCYLHQQSWTVEVLWYMCCVCLFVCLLAEYLKTLSTDLNHILWNDRPMTKDQWIRFCDWSRSRPGYKINFPFLQHGEIGCFRRITRKVVDECLWNFREGQASRQGTISYILGLIRIWIVDGFETNFMEW